MPPQRKLKVYRTPIGFHDALVAAPSQKAALEAWGSDSNLFAQGLAEEVTDSELTAEALKSPGKVIRRLRGTDKEQIAALGEKAQKVTRGIESKPKPRKPRPSRAALSEAEEGIATATARYEKELKRIAGEITALEQSRQLLEAERNAKLEEAQQRCAAELRAYERAMKQWRSG